MVVMRKVMVKRKILTVQHNNLQVELPYQVLHDGGGVKELDLMNQRNHKGKISVILFSNVPSMVCRMTRLRKSSPHPQDKDDYDDTIESGGSQRSADIFDSDDNDDGDPFSNMTGDQKKGRN